MKEVQRELEDSRAAQKEVLASARESERKAKAMEADIIQLHEVHPSSPVMKLSVVLKAGERQSGPSKTSGDGSRMDECTWMDSHRHKNISAHNVKRVCVRAELFHLSSIVLLSSCP